MLQLQLMLAQVTINENSDRWLYIWNSSNYSVKKSYKHLSGHMNVHPVFSWLWACSCQSKHKVFFWLLLKDRLSTRELLRRKRMFLQDYICVLCNANVDESLNHLFLECPFAVQCWAMINIQISPQLNPFQNLQSFKDQLGVPFFMEIIILLC